MTRRHEASSPHGDRNPQSSLTTDRVRPHLPTRSLDAIKTGIVTNAFPEPVTITFIAILGADGQVLQRLEGATIAAITQPLLGPGPMAEIPGSGTVGAGSPRPEQGTVPLNWTVTGFV